MKNRILDEWFNKSISDEAAYTLHQFLEHLSLEIDSRYFAQIRRHAQELQQLKVDTASSPHHNSTSSKKKNNDI